LKHRKREREKEEKKEFLSYYPLKQGLKQLKYRAGEILAYDFYPTIH